MKKAASDAVTRVDGSPRIPHTTIQERESENRINSGSWLRKELLT